MKYALISVGILLAVVLVIVAIGFALPVKHQSRAEATFNASPATLYALITGIEAFPSWRTGLKSAQILPSSDGKRRFRELSGDGAITYVVDANEPDRRLVTRIDDKTLPFGGSWTYEIIPATAGRSTLRIVEDGEVYNPIFRFVSRFVMRHDTTIRKYLADVGRKIPG